MISHIVEIISKNRYREETPFEILRVSQAPALMNRRTLRPDTLRNSSNFSRSCRTGSRSPSGDMRLAEGQEHEKMLHVFKLRWSIEPEQEPEGGVPNGKPRHPCPRSGFDGRNFGVKCSDQDVPRVQRSFWGGLILWRQEFVPLSSGYRCVSGGRRRFHLRTPKGMQYLRLPTG